jgi:cellulose synthase operon protein C
VIRRTKTWKTRALASLLAGLLAPGTLYAQVPGGVTPAPTPTTAPAAAPAPAAAGAPRPGMPAPMKRKPATGPIANPVASGAAPTPDELAEMAELEKDQKRYADVAAEHTDLLKKIIRRAFDDKLKKLEDKFNKAISLEEAELARRRMNAIARFEAFVAKHPRDKRWSPDVMFRLAELYFDRSKLELTAQQDAFGELMKGVGEDDPLPIDPATGLTVVPPRPNYMPSITQYRDIIANFPDYRLIDGSHYLLAYLYAEQGNPEESKQAYLGLTCATRSDGSPGYNALDVPASVLAARAAVDAEGDTPPTEAQRRAKPAPTQPPPPPVAFVDPYASCQPLVKNRKLVDEAWVRIGEQHFDMNELKLAVAAYLKVIDNKDGEFYDEALYKLAWSYYRDAVGPDAGANFEKAINRFDELVVWSDKEKAAGRGASPLRKESIEYLAISFAENWESAGQPDSGKGLERIREYYRTRGDEMHVRDVYEKLGDIYGATSQWDAAVTAYRIALGEDVGDGGAPHPKWVLARVNPRVSRKLIIALEKKGDQESGEQAYKERARLADLYREGNPVNPTDPANPASPWWQANILDREALDAARALTEGSIIESAKHFHEIAQARRKQWKLAAPGPQKTALEVEYKRLYNEAARLYGLYIEKYPNSRDTYEVSFYLAEALYWSQQYQEAAPRYAWVRDSSLGSIYQKDAALSYVKSWEEAYKLAVADPNSGVKDLPMPCKEQQVGSPPCEVVTPPLQPIPLSDVERNLRDAYDQYQRTLKKDDSSAAMLQAAALISFKHHEIDDAEVRFHKVYDGYCNTAEAAQAGQGILAIYQIQERLDDIQSWLEKMQKDAAAGKCRMGGDKGQMASLLDAVRFEKAKKLSDEGKFEESAQLYIALYNESKARNAADNTKKIDDDALWNAALSYEKMGRPKKATVIYEQLVNETPDSKHVGDALFRMALSYKAAFDYSKAVSNFLLLAENDRFKSYEFRNDALFNAAQLVEQDQQYKRSADLFQKYALAVKASKPEDSASAFYHSAEIYEKAGDIDTMIKTLRTFMKDYGSGKGTGINVVYAHYKIAKAHEKRNDKKSALGEYKLARDEFWNRGLETATPVANIAAESAFLLAEESFASYKGNKFKWTNINDEKKINADLDRLEKDGKDLAAQYQAIDKFVTPYVLAVDVRLGDISFEQGEKLYNTPVPAEIVKLDKKNPDMGVIGLYQEKLEAMVKPFRDAAQKQWENAVQTGESKNIKNEWTEQARKRLHDLDPDKWPTQKPPKTEIQVEEVR